MKTKAIVTITYNYNPSVDAEIVLSTFIAYMFAFKISIVFFIDLADFEKIVFWLIFVSILVWLVGLNHGTQLSFQMVE